MDSGRVWQTIGNSKSMRRPAARGRLANFQPFIARARVGGLACLALGAALAIAGCGSSSKPEAGATAFVSSANAACQAAFAQALAIKKPNRSGEVPTYVAHLDPIARNLLEKLTALTAPAAKQAQYTKMLALWRQEISLASARSQAVKAGDERRSQTLDEEGHNVDSQFDSTATALGLTVCARNL